MIAKLSMRVQNRFSALLARLDQFRAAQDAKKLLLLYMREVTAFWAEAVAIAVV